MVPLSVLPPCSTGAHIPTTIFRAMKGGWKGKGGPAVEEEEDAMMQIVPPFSQRTSVTPLPARATLSPTVPPTPPLSLPSSRVPIAAPATLFRLMLVDALGCLAAAPMGLMAGAIAWLIPGARADGLLTIWTMPHSIVTTVLHATGDCGKGLGPGLGSGSVGMAAHRTPSSPTSTDTSPLRAVLACP